jgi:integrase
MKMALDNVHAVHKRLSNGQIKTYYYHRITKKRIEGEPGTLAFFASYEQASKADIANSDKDLFIEIINEYRNSDDWNKLAPRTKLDYVGHLEIIKDEWGTLPLQVFRDAAASDSVAEELHDLFIKWRQRLYANSVRQGDYIIATMRRMINRKKRVLRYNPLDFIEKTYKADRAEVVWSEKLVSKLSATKYPEMYLAACFALITMQRKGDLLQMEWPRPEQDHMRWKQGKTGRTVYIPITGFFAKLLTVIPKRAETILSTPNGASWQMENFDRVWRLAKIEAGVKRETFHDLRGTAITALAGNGATDAEIVSLSGHSAPGKAANALPKYLAAAPEQAVAAMQKLQYSWIAALPLPVNQTVNRELA